jgi:cell wall-associated NlpC family hydrolase
MDGISGTALAATSAGILFLWSAVKGASVTTTLRELIAGKQPSGASAYPITASPAGQGGNSVAPSADAAAILKAAESKKGQCYGFGAGHGGDPCKSRCTDCSSYVSCVINTATGSHINMATGGLAKYGTGVSYAQRAPGDIIVWNGGTGGGHTGIIAAVDGNGGTMWNNPCTGCGGVRLSTYPHGSRSAQSAVIRRVTRR